MLSQTEAHRLAASIHALRPDWPIASLSSWIRNNLAERAYRDAAVALTWVACEASTETPARVLEAGPWWKATQAQAPTVSAITHYCPDHPSERLWDCRECAGVVGDAERGLALVRAAMKEKS